jgi:hypothetical protein
VRYQNAHGILVRGQCGGKYAGNIVWSSQRIAGDCFCIYHRSARGSVFGHSAALGSVTMNPIIIALIALAQIVLLAIVTGVIAYLKASQEAKVRSAEKAEDWRRQDQVADRVATAARQAADAATLLVKAQKETIARTDEVARVQAQSDQHISNQLAALDDQGKKIHILVNSDMTAARTNERNQIVLTVLALKRVQALSQKLGLPVDETEEESIVAAEKRIEELNQILADRLDAQKKIDKRGQA